MSSLVPAWCFSLDSVYSQHLPSSQKSLHSLSEIPLALWIWPCFIPHPTALYVLLNTYSLCPAVRGRADFYIRTEPSFTFQCFSVSCQTPSFHSTVRKVTGLHCAECHRSILCKYSEGVLTAGFDVTLAFISSLGKWWFFSKCLILCLVPSRYCARRRTS